MSERTFQLTVYVKAVYSVKWSSHCRLGARFCSSVTDVIRDVEFELDDAVRDNLTGEWGRVVAEVNA